MKWKAPSGAENITMFKRPREIGCLGLDILVSVLFMEKSEVSWGRSPARQ